MNIEGAISSKLFVRVEPAAALDIRENQVSVALWARLTQLPTELPASFGAMFDSTSDNCVVYLDRGNQELRFKVTTKDPPP